MKITNAALAAALLFASGSALAYHCPVDMKKIDDALAKKPALSASQMDEVKKYRAEGEAFHKLNKHDDALNSLGKAEKILVI